MGFWKKVQDHVLNNTIESMKNGAEYAHRATKDKGDIAKGLGAMAGASAGAFIGGLKLISPVSIAESMMRSDQEIDERTEELFK